MLDLRLVKERKGRLQQWRHGHTTGSVRRRWRSFRWTRRGLPFWLP